MKKPIHLYIFVVLSAMASLYRVYGSFFASFDEATYRQTLTSIQVDNVDQLVATAKSAVAFSTNAVNKCISVLLLALLIGVIVYLVKKNVEKASYIYIVYLFGTLLLASYTYIQQQATMVSYLLSAILFAIYFGLTIFFLLRKPKEKPSVGQTATDI